MVELPIILPDDQLADANGRAIRGDRTGYIREGSAEPIVPNLNENRSRGRVLACYAAEVRRRSDAALSCLDKGCQQVVCVARRVDI